MKVNLLGYSTFISKKGNQCMMIAIGLPDPKWKGFRVKEVFVNPDTVEGILKPLTEIDVDFDYRGNVVSVKAE